MTFTLRNTPWPDGTTVGAYDATSWNNFPTSGPPGTAETTAVASDREVTFTGLVSRRTYFAAAKVGSEWRSIRFIPGEDGTSEVPASVLAADIAAEIPPALEDRPGVVSAVGEFGATDDGIVAYAGSYRLPFLYAARTYQLRVFEITDHIAPGTAYTISLRQVLGVEEDEEGKSIYKIGPPTGAVLLGPTDANSVGEALGEEFHPPGDGVYVVELDPEDKIAAESDHASAIRVEEII